MPSSLSNNRSDNDCQTTKKRVRLEYNTGNSGNSLLKNKLYSTQWLLDNNEMSSAPTTLFGGGGGGNNGGSFKIGHDHSKLQKLLNYHGFRTSKILSPREAVSVYKDSCRMMNGKKDNNEFDDDSIRDGKEFLLVIFGLHPKQEEIENYYSLFVKDPYCITLFCQKIRQIYNFKTSEEEHSNVCDDLKRLLSEIERTCQLMKTPQQNDIYSSAEDRIDALIQLTINVKGSKHKFFRVEEWKKEYQRICVTNSTISNAYLTLLQTIHGMYIKDIFLKFSREESKYERITIYLKSDEEGSRPGLFLLLPSLYTIVSSGPFDLVSKMIESFWSHVLRNGYFPTTRIKDALDSHLRRFFLSGIVTTANPLRNATNLPLSLKANFNPAYALSLYMFGKPGTGKSSFARGLPAALQNTIEQHLDPECITRFVKQNLNKCIHTLELELEIRPNNNNLSVMSIVQSRQMSMSQSKPGLVVLNLEEMPMYSSQSNPNQVSVAQLISHRFGGRRSNYRRQEQQGKSNNGSCSNKLAPRNSDKKSIGRDFSLVTIFTSNYPLAEESKLALQQLELYQYLEPIEMASISGSDRCQFARSYFVQCLLDSLETSDFDNISTRNISLDILFSDGDTRPLVRQLRMFVFYLKKLIRNNQVQKTGQHVLVEGIQVSQKGKSCYLTVKSRIDGETSQTSYQRLKMGSLSNWYPTGTGNFDSRIESMSKNLKLVVEDGAGATELAVILEFWLSMILAPAVILSRDKEVIQLLMDAIESIGNDIHCIRNVNTQTYQMAKSLYDSNYMPNLRDDILKFGRGVLVAVELTCPTEDSQLCIREMIEDSPSMVAFSTMKSALYKSGMLFAIHVEGEVTPEVMSRVSFVL